MSRNTSVFNATSLVFGIICAVCAFLSRTLSGSPIDMIHKLDGLQMLPPIWIFNFLCVAWYFAIGAALGAVIRGLFSSCACGRGEANAYKGTIFLICSFFLGLIWYPLIFSAGALFWGLVISILMTLSSLLCAYYLFLTDYKGSALIVSGYTVWTVYQLTVSIAALFSV